MPLRNVLYVLILVGSICFFTGCNNNRNIIELPAPDYDLTKPAKLILSDALAEISGISFYPKDSSIFAISDEAGFLYKIHLGKQFRTEQWNFDQKRDYEDVVLNGEAFYVLESNGNIETLNFSKNGDTIYKRRTIFPGDNKKKMEFESLYYDDQYKGLVMICKDCEDDKRSYTTAYFYNPVTDSFSGPVFQIQTDQIAKRLGLSEIKFRPSAATINPLTSDVWVLSSTNQIIVVLDRKGVVKDVYTLNPVIYHQPEGIAFTPSGDLLIANEAGDKYNSATLLILKIKKKG
ncbi:hypothetical protein BH20BAC1_BH20BAC1_09120 [soil metagenome]